MGFLFQVVALIELFQVALVIFVEKCAVDAIDPIVVTGMGIISPAGCTLDSFFDSICNGKSAVAKLERFDASPFKCQIAAQVT